MSIDPTTGAQDGSSGPLDAPVSEPEVAETCLSHSKVLSSDIAELRDACSISFGASERYPSLPLLAYSLPAGYSGMSKKKDLWQRYIPQWVERRTVDLSTTASLVEAGDDYDGLFWEDGVLMGATKFALVTLHSYAEFASDEITFSVPCRVGTAADIREPIENGGRTWLNGLLMEPVPGIWSITWSEGVACAPDSEGSVEVWASGDVSCSFPGTSNKAAYTPGWWVPDFVVGGAVVWSSVTYMCSIARMNASLADYFFWWGARLLAWYEESGDENADRMADVCVRAAMSEIAQLSSLLLHELTHVTGSWFEDGGWPVECQNCCHYMLEIILRDKLLAEFGAPPPMAANGIDLASAGVYGPVRFDPDIAGGFLWGYAIGPTKTGGSNHCDGLTFLTNRPNLWTHGGGVDIAFSVPTAACWEDDDPRWYDRNDTVVHSGQSQGAGRNRSVEGQGRNR